MRFCALADLHFSAFSNESVIEGIPEKLYFTRKTLDIVIDECRKSSIKLIVIAGDVFHTKSIVHTLAQSQFLDFIRTNKDFNFIIIDGNHDLSSRSGDGVSILKCCDNEPNVKMIHSTTKIENVLFVPWDPKTMISDIKSGGTPYLVTHLGLSDAKLNSGISIVSDIKLSDLKQYTKCFLGHYHKPQEIGNSYYIGSPIQMDWGEKGDEKRYLLIDTDNNSIASIPTKGYKKYCQLDITMESKSEIIEEARDLIKNGHYVKISKTEEFDSSDIEKEFRVIDKSEKDITNRGINSTMSNEEKIEKYLKIKNIPENKMNFYKQIGMKIIQDSIKEKS